MSGGAGDARGGAGARGAGGGPGAGAVRRALPALAAGLAVLAACDPSRTGAVDEGACLQNCQTLEGACPGFDGDACRAACREGDMGRLGCIEDRVQDGKGDCADFVACFPAQDQGPDAVGETGTGGDAGGG